MSQRDDEGVLHSVAQFSKKHTPADCNYDIYDKDLRAIIKAPEEWRPEYEGATYPLQLITHPKNIEDTMKKKILNRRQSWWVEFLTDFDYQIVYRPGKWNGKVDALTRRPGDLPDWGDERLQNMEQVVLKPHNLSKKLHLLVDGLLVQFYPSIPDLSNEAYVVDQLPGRILEAIGAMGSLEEITVRECMEQEGRFRYWGKEYVLELDQLFLHLTQNYHDTALAGHAGRAKTFNLLDRQYYWKDIRKQVDHDVQNCHDHQRSRTSRHSTFTVL